MPSPWWSATRAIAALILGAATTLFLASALPLLIAVFLEPSWSSGPAPLPPGVSAQSRPLVDLFSVSPASLQAGAPLPSAVRTAADPAVYVRVDTALAGWPLRAMASEAWVPRTGPLEFRGNLHLTDTRNGPILVPLRPIPLGFLADVACFTPLWYAIGCIGPLRPGWWLAGRRLRLGRCPACGYDLGWNLAPGCPECAWRRGGPAP